MKFGASFLALSSCDWVSCILAPLGSCGDTAPAQAAAAATSLAPRSEVVVVRLCLEFCIDSRWNVDMTEVGTGCSSSAKLACCSKAA